MNIKYCGLGLLLTILMSFAGIASTAEKKPNNSPLSSNQTNSTALWPNTQYDPQIPTFQAVLGYSIGERITNPDDMLRFFEALAAAAPDRIKLFEYGRSWQNRKLIYAAIGSPNNIANLQQFSRDMKNFADPRITSKAKAKKLASTLPGSLWLAHSVHGNEISSTDAAMLTAYHLLAAPQQPINKKILSNTLVFIDPLQNPDGRNRFTNHYYATVGLEHSDDRLSAEHNEPWPGGRTNHYLFDMNRDWLAMTQPETEARIKAINQYLPLVVIDLHEMSGDSSYYFAPAAQPTNPHMSKSQIDNISLVGQNNAKHFDKFGFDYFTREIFDSFYPGYGDSWPTFYGAAASTYEVASARGEKYRKSSGEVVSYKDTVQRHFVASIATAESVADNRQKLLNDFYDFQVNAIAAGKADKKERVFILPNQRDKAGSHKLASLMVKHGVEVSQAEQSFKACGKRYAAGAFVIDSAQPRGRFVKTVFTKQVDMADSFIKEQERRRSRKLRDEIYDVTGWSLPLMFNIDTDTCGSAVKVSGKLLGENQKLLAKVTNPDATIAYLVPWGDMAAARFLSAALQQGLYIKSADKSFTLDNKKAYPGGTLIIEKSKNSPELAVLITQIAEQTGATVHGVNTSWITSGPSFGSNNTAKMVAPNIAIAWDRPTNPLSAGNTRFVIERQFNYPVTAIRTRTLKTADLKHYQVLILPSGNYKGVLDQAAVENLKRWVKSGGVLITLGSATKFAADAEIGLLDVKREQAYLTEDQAKRSASKATDKKSTSDGKLLSSKADLTSAIENSQRTPDYVSGVLANVEVDQEHWLTAGVAKNVITMVLGSDIYSPIKLASGTNVAWFSGPKQLLASGYLWQQSREQLAYKPFLIVQPSDNGMLISFTQEPTSRAYLDGLNVLLMNSIFRGAAHATPLP